MPFGTFIEGLVCMLVQYQTNLHANCYICVVVDFYINGDAKRYALNFKRPVMARIQHPQIFPVASTRRSYMR